MLDGARQQAAATEILDRAAPSRSKPSRPPFSGTRDFSENFRETQAAFTARCRLSARF